MSSTAADFTPAPVEEKHDVFSLEGLIAWLETQPPETEYDFRDILDCLLCRYGRAAGLNVHSAGGSDIVRYRQDGSTERSAGFAKDVASDLPWTYGAALTRARALLAEGE